MASLSNSKDDAVECKMVVEKGKVEEVDDNDDESFSCALQLCNSLALSMAIQTAIELGVFEVLQKAGKGAQLSATEIVSRLCFNNTNVEAPKMLDRVLVLFASHSLLNCSIIPDDQQQQLDNSFHRHYSMTPVAKYFSPNSAGISLGPLIALTNDKIFLDSWSELKNAIQEGGNPFKRVHGKHAFEYASLDSRFNKVFNTAMISHTTIVMNRVLECYKGFEEVKTLVDVGGGFGININMITSKYPHIHGIHFDLPHVLQHAPSYPGVEHIGGNMFESVPKGDAILMKWIIHDWSDEYCLKLLKNCYDSIPNDGKVIVIEAIIPIIPTNEAACKSTFQLDVLMMTECPTGKERSEVEFIDLATRVGFRDIKFECCVCNIWVMELLK